MRWVLIGVLVLTAGCGASRAYYGETPRELDKKMEEMMAKERAAAGLDDTYKRLEKKWSGR